MTKDDYFRAVLVNIKKHSHEALKKESGFIELASEINRWSIEAFQELEKLDNWQPIETAPRDGRDVLLFDYSGVSVIGCWNIIADDGFFSTEYLPVDASHWMPLPEPPKEG